MTSKIQIITAATVESAITTELRRLVRAIHAVRPETQDLRGFLGGSDGYGVPWESAVFTMRMHTEDPPECDCEPGRQDSANYQAWIDAGRPQHAPPKHVPCALDCANNLPNFRHHATGFEVRWHKWIGRSLEVVNLPANLPAVIDECIASVTGRPVVRYRTIYADPPWPERGGGKSKRGADRHYKLMTVRQIKALPVGDLADHAGCVLWLWATGNYLADAIDCAREWGFRVVNFRPWVKAVMREVLIPPGPQSNGGECFAALPQNPGLGQYMRCDAEILLLCVRGKVDLPPIKTRQTIYAPRGKHSAKPHGVRIDIETNYSAPRLELFARKRHEGWDVYGDQVEGSIVLPGAPCPTP